MKITRTDIINHLIKYYNYKSYLEIGVQDLDENFNRIECVYKIGVDPNGCASYTGFSDDFFEQNKTYFDLIFIDGDHRHPQVSRDIINSLEFLSENGTIVLHDCLPLEEFHQSEENNGDIWNGTVWKSLTRLRQSNHKVKLNVVNIDWGVGILRKENSSLYLDGYNDELDFDFYLKHAISMFDVISTDQFFEKYNLESYEY